MTSNSSKSAWRRSALPFAMAMLAGPWLAACSREQDLPSHEEIVAEDFGVILELNDQDCGVVTSFEKIEQLAYKVTCKSGEVFRIDVSHEGHVNVATHEE